MRADPSTIGSISPGLMTGIISMKPGKFRQSLIIEMVISSL